MATLWPEPSPVAEAAVVPLEPGNKAPVAEKPNVGVVGVMVSAVLLDVTV